MSGGSFNYLYREAEWGELVQRKADLIDMQEAVRQYDYAPARQVAQRFDELVALLRSAEREAKRLAPVMQAIEWNHSCDWGEDQVLDAMREYLKKDGST